MLLSVFEISATRLKRPIVKLHKNFSVPHTQQTLIYRHSFKPTNQKVGGSNPSQRAKPKALIFLDL